MFLFLPDPLIMPNILSGSVLLYFDGPFYMTAPPTLVTPESLELLKLVQSRQPIWNKRLSEIVQSMFQVNQLTKVTWEKLKAIDPKLFKLIYCAFPANYQAYEQVNNWVAASGYTYEQLIKMVVPTLGSAELSRHIFLERYLELECDLDRLYDYCEIILTSDSIDSLIVASYLLRLQIVLNVEDIIGQESAEILLTNECLAPLIEKLLEFSNVKPFPVHDIEKEEMSLSDNVVAWEFFRVLVSQIIDPLNDSRLDQIMHIRTKKYDAVTRLRERCCELAAELRNETSLVGLGDRAMKVIELKLRKELREIFELDNKTWHDLVANLSTDKVLWNSIAGMLATGLTGVGAPLTTASIVSALVSIGTNAVKARNAREQELRQNDFALLYLLNASK